MTLFVWPLHPSERIPVIVAYWPLEHPYKLFIRALVRYVSMETPNCHK